MKKISLHVDGMCESHENDAVRKVADVKKYDRRAIGFDRNNLRRQHRRRQNSIRNQKRRLRRERSECFGLWKARLVFDILICSPSDLFYIKNTRPKRRVFFCSALNTQKKRLTGCQPFGFDAVIRCHPVCFPVFRRFFRSPFQIARVFLRHHRFLQRGLRWLWRPEFCAA